MHHSTKRRVVLGMTTGGLLLTGVGMSVAQADASAEGGAAHSPGLLSGNLVQAPVDAPINVCGNVIDVIGAFDTAAGNHCGNAGAPGGNASSAHGAAKDSPGAVSGNLVQAPIDVPVNICGNSASGVGVGDAAFDNTCSNGGGHGSNGASAHGGSHSSPGLGSGNTVQLPISTPLNVCGNSASGVGVGDAAFDNTCSNGGSVRPPSPPVSPPRTLAPPTCGCHPTPTPTSTTPTAPSTPSSPATPTAPWTPSAPATPSAPGKVPPTGGTHGSTGPTGTHGGTLAQTGVGTGTVMAPFGAGVLGGGGLLVRKLARRYGS
ncbi:chaplin [Actinospica robiniae]|uniref:chaplin n=1 Tax=Actinospica robiniae TaxID=304901 RepID=UPI000428C8A2|nr:chaplin [Actinospica robiniae]